MWKTNETGVDVASEPRRFSRSEDRPRALHQQDDYEDDPYQDADDESAHALRVNKLGRQTNAVSAAGACSFVASSRAGLASP